MSKKLTIFKTNSYCVLPCVRPFSNKNMPAKHSSVTKVRKNSEFALFFQKKNETKITQFVRKFFDI